MTNWAMDVYLTPATLEAAVEAIANTVTIHVVPFMEGGKQKFALIKSA